jgi:hypothetical protein
MAQRAAASPLRGDEPSLLDSGSLRASDREREAVIQDLSRHFTDGRINIEEFDERVGLAMTARLRADLASLVCDLPALAETPSVSHHYRYLATAVAGLFAIGLVFFVLLVTIVGS